MTPTELPLDFLERLKEALGAERVRTAPGDCWAFGGDNSRRHAPPAVVVEPDHHEQIIQIVRACRDYRVPLVARGHGTCTTGAAVSPAGGLVLSMNRLNRIHSVDPDNRIMVVEPGVTNARVQQAAAKHGFFWPPDPTSAAVCTIGGNLACNAAGPRAVKYGTPRENVLSLRAVTGLGESLQTGTRTTKGVVGYDLTRLLIGSEGTLAVITEATLKLTPLPEQKRTLRAFYRDVESAAHAVARIMAQPVTPCALEFIDGRAIEMIRHYSKAKLPAEAGALLMIEVDGPAACVGASAGSVATAARVEGHLDVAVAESAEEVKQLWETRKALSPALRTVAPKKINEDVVVPVSQMPRFIRRIERLGQKHEITIVNFGHAGNGNIHVNLLIDPDDPKEMKRAGICLGEIFDTVLSLGGTLSGEHGIGLEKRDFVAREIEPPALELMHRIRRQFDPEDILNPGKKLPTAD